MGKGKPRHDAKNPPTKPTDTWRAWDLDITTDDGDGDRRVEIVTDAGFFIVYSNGYVEGPY